MSFETLFENVTTTMPTPHNNTALVSETTGFVALGVSVLFLGSNYLPIKEFETGDGMFFNLMMGLGIWLVSFVVHCAREFPRMYLVPMLGGVFWTTGNLFVVPIIKSVGIGIGSLMWNTVLLVLGWAIARFGIFGIEPEVPSQVGLNYFGVVLAVLSGIFYLFVKYDEPQSNANSNIIVNDNQEEEREHLLEGSSSTGYNAVEYNNEETGKGERFSSSESEKNFVEKLSPGLRRTVGMSLALVAGILYAFTFTPSLVVQDTYADASQDALDYVFSMYTGILSCNMVYFSIYCLLKRNKPLIYPRVALPALVSGIMWGIGNSSFFLASTALSEAVTFPIAASGPSGVSMLWSVFLYNEIRGAKNLSIMMIGFALAVCGSVMCGISK